MMLVATLMIVFCRWSTDFSSHSADAELVLHVRARLVRRLAALVEQPAVDRADAQLRQAVFVQHGAL